MTSKRQKAKDLVELACNDGTTDKERVAAAIRAVGLIKKYDLLSSPIESMLNVDNEAVQAVGDLLNVVTDPKVVGSVKTLLGRLGSRRRSRR